MGKFIDMTGQTFGQLTVLRRDPNRKPTAWICRCSCGKEHTVNASNLRRGLSGHCPECAAKQHGQTRSKLAANGRHQKSFIDLTGQRFGDLVVVSYTGSRRWVCKCDCGGTTLLNITELKTRKDCGCKQRQLQIDRFVSHLATGELQTRRLESIISAGNKPANNSSGAIGVSVKHNVAQDVYVASIMVDGKQIYLGRFGSLEAAVRARKRAEEKYFAPRIDKHRKKIPKSDPEKGES